MADKNEDEDFTAVNKTIKQHAILKADGITKDNTVVTNVISWENIKNKKQRASLYTADKVAVARENVKKYSWARAKMHDAVLSADRFIALGNDFLWNLVTPQLLPRSYTVNDAKGSPTSGTDIYTKTGSSYPWIIDPVKHPWKIQDPLSNEYYPTNDFESFYNSGLNDNGIFDPESADKQYLINRSGNGRGDSWGVDDGFGFIDIDGTKYTFISYYNHWLWYTGEVEGYGFIQRALDSLRDAYLYTGKAKYVQSGAILLDRIADIYPSMDSSVYKWEDGFQNSHGGTGLGKVIGSIWETLLVPSFIRAYDAFYPGMDDPSIISFLSAKALKYDIFNPKSTSTAIKYNIEDGILRQVVPGVKNCQLEGNTGMQQNCVALAAVVIDSLPETKDWLKFDFRQSKLATNPRTATGGDLWPILVNDVDRDGQGNEASPHYNKLWLEQLKQVADVIDGYFLEGLDFSADLYKNPKFKKMFSAFYPLILSSRYTAQIGDTGAVGNPSIIINADDCIDGFMKTGDPILAQLAYFLNHNTTSGIHADIFTKDPEKVTEDIQNVIRTKGEFKLESSNMTGFGFTALRDGLAHLDQKVNTQRDIWLYYGRNSGHGHGDTLNIGMHAFGLDIAPELGYPEVTGEDAKRLEWISNTISHNTIVVDKAKQDEQIVGQPLHFDDSDTVKLIDVDARGVYKQTQMYRRTTAMIKVDNENSYTLDLFRVKGGNDHYYSFHSTDGTVSTEGLNFTVQHAGTYAGPEIDFCFRTDSVPGWGYIGSGFHYLKNVQKQSNPQKNFSIDWKINDFRNILPAAEDIHLKMTILNDVSDVALTDGVPPQRSNNPETLKYVIAHRTGTNLNSLFTAIYQPYKVRPFIDSMTTVPVTLNGTEVTDGSAVAVKVVLKNGRTDYIVNALDKTKIYMADNKINFKGFFGVYSEKNGQQVSGYLNDGTVISNIHTNTDSLSGTVSDFTKELSSSNIITVNLTSKNIDFGSLAGRYIYVENDGIRNASYRINRASKIDDTHIALYIGDTTLIRSYVNSSDFSKGYTYDVSVGLKCSIPLSSETLLG